jgi:hypothetical protein
MNLKLVFRIFGVVNLINAVGVIFATRVFFEMAGMTVTPDMINVGQGFGIAILSLAILSWRTPDIAGDAAPSYGQLFGIISSINLLHLGYLITSGQASGPPAYGNIALMAMFVGLFFFYSKKS